MDSNTSRNTVGLCECERERDIRDIHEYARECVCVYVVCICVCDDSAVNYFSFRGRDNPAGVNNPLSVYVCVVCVSVC